MRRENIENKGRMHSPAHRGLLLLLLLFALITFAISQRRDLNVDEVEHLHAAYTVARGGLLYTDIWQGHQPLLYYILSPLIFPEAPEFTVRIIRGVMYLLQLGSVLLVAGIGQRLLGWRGVLLAPSLLFLQTTFATRGTDIRPDVPAAFLLTAAFTLFVLPQRRLFRFGLQGLLLGVAFLFSKKIAVGCVAFGLIWCVDAVRTRQASSVIVPMALWSLPVALCLALMARLGIYDDYMALNFRDVLEMSQRKAKHVVTPPSATFVFGREFGRNPVFMTSLILGIPYGLSRWRQTPELAYASLFVLICCCGLVANPYPWAYNYLVFLPVGAVLVAAAMLGLGDRLTLLETQRNIGVFIATCLLLCAIPGSAYLIERAGPNPVFRNQLRTLQEVSRVTSPADAVFDRAGLHLRPSGHWQYLMNGIQYRKFQMGLAPYETIEETLRARKVVAIIVNRRIQQWRNRRAKFREFFEDHYVHYNGNLYVQGTNINLDSGASQTFDAMRSKQMVFQGEGSILIDGEPFTRGMVRRGRHVIESSGKRARGTLILAAPRPPASSITAPAPLFGSENPLVKPTTF